MFDKILLLLCFVDFITQCGLNMDEDYYYSETSCGICCSNIELCVYGFKQ